MVGRFIPRLVACSATVLLVGAAPAAAQAPGATSQAPQRMQVDLGSLTTDAQGTHFTVPATCTTPAPGTSACAMTVVVSAQRTPAGKWQPKGPVTALQTVPVTVPAGATQVVVADVPPAKLRAPLTRARGAAIVTTSFQDAQGEVASAGVYVQPPRVLTACGEPYSARIVSGVLEEDDPAPGSPKDNWQQVFSPDVTPSVGYRVSSAKAAITFDGVRWTFTQGSRFAISCTALSDFFQARGLPAIALSRGQVRATGTPRGRLYAATVMTLEGNLGMRRAEATDLTVARDDARSVSTMHVTRGRSGQVTTAYKGTHGGHRNSPCTSGRALSVNRYGIIKPLG